MTDIKELAKGAYIAADALSYLDTDAKNRILLDIARSLRESKSEIFAVNRAEVERAVSNGLDQALTDRLTLNDSRFEEMVSGVEKVASLSDPVGRIYDGVTLPNGLRLYKKSVPLGVVGVIYESRPNVTVDIAALCLKSSNACILRCGSEALHTCAKLHEIMSRALLRNGIDQHVISFVDDQDRSLVREMLKQNQYIDVIIPRGGEKLQRMCQEQSSIPVIIGGFGISHIFADDSCDPVRAIPVIVNAKVQKPSACNALDTLLVHRKIAPELIPALLEQLCVHNVKVHAHGDALPLCQDYPYLEQATAADFDREFLALEMNISLVDDVREAALHLREHRASHSDAILTDSKSNADYFCARAGSACVYVNASTRFTDGGQFGLGAEVAISTQKLHVRGPMALDALTTYQYVCQGDYLART